MTNMNPSPLTATQTSDMTSARACPEKRKKYSGNDVLRLMKILDETKMDMDRKSLAMNDVVHLVLDSLDGLRARKCSCADLARLLTSSGFPITERTLKDYLARSRKDAREGRTEYSELKKHILDAAKSQESMDNADTAEAFHAGDDDNIAEQSASSDDFAAPDNDFLTSAVSADMDSLDSLDTKNMKRQHIQDIYAARKRRKKARKRK